MGLRSALKTFLKNAIVMLLIMVVGYFLMPIILPFVLRLLGLV